MGFRINTNTAALSAHTSATMNNRSLDSSLAKLSSGLRINTAADDASGMAIADSLRSQANSLGQAVSNANDAIGLIQTADKAMDEQTKILDTIKTKAVQAASDTQTTASRTAIQKDVNRLLEQLDNIAKTTSFNGQVLLSGKFTNKEFQIGAFSNQTIKTSVNNTQALAIGNIATRQDIVQLGNTTTVNAAARQNATVISAAALTGLAKGDTIRIDGVGDYKISYITSEGNVNLTEGLAKAITAGTTVSVVSNVAENINKVTGSSITAAVTTAAGAVTIATTDLSGFAVGDVIQLANTAGETANLTITGVSSAGNIIGTADATLASTSAAGLTVSLGSRAVVGSAFTASDYVQYNVEGTSLTGVQLTNSSAEGVANTGLGKVADLINEATSTTGVKATAKVEANSLIGVAAGTLSADMKINGVTIMQSGQSIKAGDSDNALINAINEKSSLTGVKASLEADGTLTLKSDGRAMKLEAFTSATGINDGTYAGKLELTKNGLEVMDVTAKHYTDAALTTAGSGTNLEEVVKGHKLSELVTGQKDSNGDGTINSDDAVGLLMTKEGAMLAMDIVEAATKELDSTRADLGSVQNQLTVTVNNISVTQVNVKSAESTLRDVDFASESANFSKYNILAQSGSYAMSQANSVQQNVMKLLQ